MSSGATFRVHAGLVRLALRRTLPWTLAAGHGLLLLVAASRRWTPESAALPGDALALAADAYLRQAVWMVFAVFALPLVCVRAAGTGEMWRRRDADWLGALPLGRGGFLASTWLGTLLGALVLVLVTALVAEATTRDAGPAMRWERTLENAPIVLHEGDAPRSIELDRRALASLGPGSRLRVEVTVAPGSGPAVTTEAALEIPGAPAASSRTGRRVFGRTVLELELPAEARSSAQEGDATLTLSRRSEGAVLVLPRDGLEIVVPVRSSHLVSVELARRTLVALAAWIGLALGLGAWMRAGYAAGLTLAVAVASWRWLADGPLATVVPGAELVRSWTLAGAGLVPPGAAWTQLLGAAALAVAGVFAARAGLARGRSVAR